MKTLSIENRLTQNKEYSMNLSNNGHYVTKVRIANFCGLSLGIQNVLSLTADDIGDCLQEIRTHSDFPYVYLLSKEQLKWVFELLSELRSIRSTCFPHALFLIDNDEVTLEEPLLDDVDLDIFQLKTQDSAKISEKIVAYAQAKFRFDHRKLEISNPKKLPDYVDVLIVGAGVTGLYAANKLQSSKLSFCVVEQKDKVGGIWSLYANRTSQVNTSEAAYRLVEKAYRSNRDHSTTREILEDIAQLSNNVPGNLYSETKVDSIRKIDGSYIINATRNRESYQITCRGVILAINDRVGMPREIVWENQDNYQGLIIPGISNAVDDIDWKNQKVAIVGMGAFAVENARTALEGGASHVTVVCRRHGTVCPKIIDYLNFTTPYDEEFKHDKKSNMRNMLFWKKLYDHSGAKQPECWMGKVKHDGHTISVSDIWFIGHFLKKLETVSGVVSGMYENGLIVDENNRVEADIVINCIGFQRNASHVSEICDYTITHTNNFLDKNFMYLADAHIDDDAFNSLFGSSVLEMVKFYLDVYLYFFDNEEYDSMIRSDGIDTVAIQDRKWSDYISAAAALMNKYPDIYEKAKRQVAERTGNFMEAHDLQTYIAANRREWIDTHSLLAGKSMKAEDCLPYVFEKLIKK